MTPTFLTKPLAKYIGLPLAGAIAAGTLFWVASAWLDRKMETAADERQTQVEQKLALDIAAANEKARASEQAMLALSQNLGASAQRGADNIHLTIDPLIGTAQNEVNNDARYRECVISDSMLKQQNEAGNTVNVGLATGNRSAH